jgi:hypothetical protein
MEVAFFVCCSFISLVVMAIPENLAQTLKWDQCSFMSLGVDVDYAVSSQDLSR